MLFTRRSPNSQQVCCVFEGGDLQCGTNHYTTKHMYVCINTYAPHTVLSGVDGILLWYCVNIHRELTC